MPKNSNLLESLGTDRLELAADVIKAMGHPSRIAILEMLRGNSKVSVSEIYKTLDLNQAVASQHLIHLKDRGVLKSVKEGKSIFYHIRDKEIEEILKNIVKVAENRAI